MSEGDIDPLVYHAANREFFLNSRGQLKQEHCSGFVAIAEQQVVGHSVEFDDLIRALDENGVNLQRVLIRPLERSGEMYFIYHPGSDREDKMATVTRDTDLDWAHSHPEEMAKLKGKWVALEEQGLVASGSSLSELMQEVRSQTLDYNPLVTFIPIQKFPQYL